MRKGEATKQQVLERAAELARTVGIEGLTIGKLADELHLSKSGLFAHVSSKENLQVEVLREAARQFVEEVVSPAFRARRGEPRLRALFDRWLAWAQKEGGCVFVTAAAELDDRPGPPREAAVAALTDWRDTLAQAARIAIDEGHFRTDLDPRKFAYELQGILLSYHHWSRLLRDAVALSLARRAFDDLVERSRR